MDSSFSGWLASMQEAAPRSGGGGGYFANVKGIRPNQIPALWYNFAGQGERLINRQAGARRQTLLGTRRDFERNLLNTYQQSGLDPLFARMRIAEEQPQFRGAAGEIEAGRLDEILGFRTGIANALAENMAGERQLDIQGYLAAKARQQARHGSKTAGKFAIGQGLASLLGSAAQGYLSQPATPEPGYQGRY